MRQYSGGIRNQTPSTSSREYREQARIENRIVREIEQRRGADINRINHNREIARRYIRIYDCE
jgi:hypothetical protein